jgi:hypothetical protein
VWISNGGGGYITKGVSKISSGITSTKELLNGMAHSTQWRGGVSLVLQKGLHWGNLLSLSGFCDWINILPYFL